MSGTRRTAGVGSLRVPTGSPARWPVDELVQHEPECVHIGALRERSARRSCSGAI